MNNEFKHIPVLFNECISSLNIKEDGIYVDCTLGGGGHSKAILDRLTTGRLIAFDKDSTAIEYCTNKFKDNKNITIIKEDFKKSVEHLKLLDINQIDGYLIDLGISSYQIDTPERGFSYMSCAPLDMRMDQTQKLTAYDIINNYSSNQLIEILKKYGEEDYATSIVRNIIKERETKTINTTFDLISIIDASTPAAYKRKGHCAKKTFQALRIAVNNELEGLYDFIQQITMMLKKDGIGCVISFHSLEDRIVKTAFNYLQLDCICENKKLMCNCNKRQEIILVNKKPITATEKELEENIRSKSAKLRVIKRV